MTGNRFLDSLLALDRPWGDRSRDILLGPWRFSLQGLSDRLAWALDERFGPHVAEPGPGSPRMSLRIFRGSRDLWLPRWKPLERYRIEGGSEGGLPWVRSYHFALSPDDGPEVWRAALAGEADEEIPRIADNAVRCLASRVAIEEGGFALHGAGVLRDGRAHLLAGPSRSGKTTAVRLSAPAPSLGDDFAIALATEGGWLAPALPFDSSERAPEKPKGGPFPVAGVWRLFHALVPHVESVPPLRAAASLMGCVAFPWAMPDLAERLLEHVRRFVREVPFAHLHFRNAPDFWDLIG